MEQQINDDNYFDNSSCEDILNIANHRVDEVISSALNSLERILASPCISLTTTPSTPLQSPSISTPNRSLQPTVSIRCRSSSRNNQRDREISFHHTIPRCSLPATKKDFVQYRSHLLSSRKTNQTRCRSSHTVNGHSSNRNFDVQYSFSLNKPWLTKIDKQRHNLISVQNFVNELIEHSMRAALLQIDYQNLADDNTSIYTDDTSCLLFDCSPSYIPIERFQPIESYVDQFVHSTIEQTIEDISFSNEDLIEHLSDRLTENVIVDALSMIAGDEIYSRSLLTDDEKHARKSKKLSSGTIRLINNENLESQTSLFHQIRHRSSSAFRSITNTNMRRDTIDTIVNNITQQICTDSFDELRRIFETNSDK